MDKPRGPRGTPLFLRCFVLFNHYSHVTDLDLFPVRCPRGGGTLQAHLCPPPMLRRFFEWHAHNFLPITRR